jgi:hypothetical protein
VGLEKGYTPLAREAITDSGAKTVSFKEAESQVEKLSGLFVSSTTIRAHTYARGAEVSQRQAAEAEAAMEVVSDPRPAGQAAGLAPGKSAKSPPDRIAVSQDGTSIRTYDGWREVKISATSVVENEPPPSPAEPPQVKQVAHSYRAGIWTTETLRAHHSADVTARGFDNVEDVAALGDGAAWIWKNFAYCFPTRTEILDWIHGKNRLQEAAHAVWGEEAPQAQDWMGRQLAQMLQGNPLRVRRAVRQLDATHADTRDLIRRVGQYFEDHAHRMRYDVFREAGYPIGSGTVESAAKTVVESRMKRSGQTWAVPNANRLLALRAELLSEPCSHAA